MVTDLRLGCILTMCLEQGKDQIYSACYMPVLYLLLAVVSPESYHYPHFTDEQPDAHRGKIGPSLQAS